VRLLCEHIFLAVRFFYLRVVGLPSGYFPLWYFLSFWFCSPARPFRVGLALRLLGDSGKNRAVIKQVLDFVINLDFVTNDCGDFSVSKGGFENCHFSVPFVGYNISLSYFRT
jgi:hypothetical protein